MADANTTCERCSGAFRCGAPDRSPCWCNGLALSASLLAQLRQSYQRCLCPACLRELAQADASAVAPRPLP